MASLTLEPLALRILAAAASSIVPLDMVDMARDRVGRDINGAIIQRPLAISWREILV